MNNEQVQKLQDSIFRYIENVGEEKIHKRTLEKSLKSFRELFDSFFKSINKNIKSKGKFKADLKLLKDKKLKAGATLNEKIELNKEKCIGLRELLKYEEIKEQFDSELEGVVLLEKYLLSLNIYEQWFDWALDFGEGSYLATHIAKLSHSSSKGTSIDVRYFVSREENNSKYLFTSDVEYLDCAYPDNKYSSISKLYKIEYEGVFVSDVLRNQPMSLLEGIISNEELLKKSCKSFSAIIKNEKKKSYFLSKQIYFPLNENNYHLLLPLTSSSLAQAMHLEHQKYFGDEQRAARDQRKKNKYSLTKIISYPNKAKLNITGSNHSNASALNGARGGKVILLPAQPPQWKGQLISYRQSDKFFTKKLSYHLVTELKELEIYLELLKSKKLSHSQPDRAKAIFKKLQVINSALFDLVLLINQNEQQPNWTLESTLPIESQLLFESWREDEMAKSEKRSDDWQTTVSRQFSIWLNRQLNKNKKLALTPIHAALWAQIFARDLSAFVAVQEVSV